MWKFVTWCSTRASYSRCWLQQQGSSKSIDIITGPCGRTTKSTQHIDTLSHHMLTSGRIPIFTLSIFYAITAGRLFPHKALAPPPPPSAASLNSLPFFCSHVLPPSTNIHRAATRLNIESLPPVSPPPPPRRACLAAETPPPPPLSLVKHRPLERDYCDTSTQLSATKYLVLETTQQQKLDHLRPERGRATKKRSGTKKCPGSCFFLGATGQTLQKKKTTKKLTNRNMFFV